LGILSNRESLWSAAIAKVLAHAIATTVIEMYACGAI